MNQGPGHGFARSAWGKEGIATTDRSFLGCKIEMPCICTTNDESLEPGPFLVHAMGSRTRFASDTRAMLVNKSPSLKAVQILRLSALQTTLPASKKLIVRLSLSIAHVLDGTIAR